MWFQYTVRNNGPAIDQYYSCNSSPLTGRYSGYKKDSKFTNANREITHVMKAMKINKVAIMALDVPNAFDRLNFEFLVAVIENLRFSRKFIQLIALLLIV